MRNEWKNLLSNPFKGIRDANGALSRLWRTILFDKGVSPIFAENMMQKYLNDPRNNAANGSDRSSRRNNLSNALAEPDMTWKTLLRGFRMLNPVKIKLVVEITWRNEEVSVHSVDVKFYDNDEDETDESVPNE